MMQRWHKKTILLIILIILLLIIPLTFTQTQQVHITKEYAATSVSPLIFGTNLTLNDANDQFITSQQTRSQLSQIHVQLIRIPIRGVGGPAPWEVTAMQDIKTMGISPIIILKYSQADPAGAAKLVIQQANTIFGNSVVYYEFGNERDLAGIDQVAYTNTWNQVLPQIKSLPTNGRFGGPTNFQTNPTYIAYFVEHANPSPDFISWHEYTCGNSTPSQTCIDNIHHWTSHITNTKSAIQANPTHKTVPPIFITEWNYDPNNPSPDPRATPQFQQQFTQTALQELSNDGVTGATHYVATGHTEYNLVDLNGQLTAEGQTFGQMYTQLIGTSGGSPVPTSPLTTPPPGTTAVSVTICPHGMGNCGDSINPGSGGNTNPKHIQHKVTVTILDASGGQIATGQGTIPYSSSQSNFTGTIPISNLATGSYIVRVKMDGFLASQIPGIPTITSGQTTVLPSVSSVAGDIDNNNQLDLLDYNILVGCFGSKQNSSSCTMPPTTQASGADINDDGVVDGVDYNLFIREISVQKSGSGGNPTPTSTPNPTSTVTQPPQTGNKLFGVNIAGADFQNPQYAGSGYSGYAYYHNKGLTLIRLPFTWEKMQPTLNGPLGGDINKLTDMITAAQRAGELVFIEPHNYARYNKTPLTPADSPAFANFWKQLAGKYSTGFPGLWGYELMNEPHDLAGGCSTWQTLAQAAVTAIRQSDTTHYILLPGYAWQAAKDWTSQSGCLSSIHDPVNKMFYSAHEYFDSDNSGTHSSPCPDPQLGVQRLQPFLSFLSQNNAKGLLTEYGSPVTSCWLTTLDNFMTALNTNSNIIGGTYWSGGPFWGNYFMSVEPSGGQDKPQMSILQKYPSH